MSTMYFKDIFNPIIFILIAVLLSGCGSSDGSVSQSSGSSSSFDDTPPSVKLNIIDRSSNLGDYVLDGSGSSGAIVSFSWQIIKKPDASHLTLSALPSDRMVSVVPDVSGEYAFRLTATSSDGVNSFKDIVAIMNKKGSPVLKLISDVSPDPIIASDRLYVGLSVSSGSNYEITSVTGVLGNQTMDLKYNDMARCYPKLFLPYRCPGFFGSMDTSKLPSGNFTLTLQATDFSGATSFLKVNVTHSNPPALTVSAPENLTIANPSVHLLASCKDDIGACNVAVRLNGSQDYFVAPKSGSIDQVVDFSVYQGDVLTVQFEATNTNGQLTSIAKAVYVESSKRLTVVDKFDGQILDFLSGKVIYILPENGTDSLYISDKSSGSLVSKYTLPNSMASRVGSGILDQAFLTKSGALISNTANDVGSTTKILELRSGLISDLGESNSPSSLAATQNYAIWSTTNRGLVFRNLETEIETALDSVDQGSLAENGVVVWVKQHQIYSSQQGGLAAQITSDPNSESSRPVSDGSSVAYTNSNKSIYLYDGQKKVALTDGTQSRSLPSSGREYQIRNGWVFYTDKLTQFWSDTNNLWGYSSTVNAVKRTHFNNAQIWIDSAGDNGEVMIFMIQNNIQKRYLSKPNGDLIEIGSTLGKTKMLDGKWYIAIAGTLFQVNTD